MLRIPCVAINLLGVVVGAAALSGCDKINQGVVQPAVEEATAGVTRNDLAATGLAYHSYHDAYSQGPPGWDEFISFAEQSSLDPAAIRKVRDAGYQIQWNTRFSDVTGGLSNTVLAEKPGGGPKLMFDGSVQ